MPQIQFCLDLRKEKVSKKRNGGQCPRPVWVVPRYLFCAYNKRKGRAWSNINITIENYDDIIDNQEIMIEGECLHILLKERPYASDLRKVTGILKLISDLERLGDHAEDILEFALKLKNTEKHSNEIIGKMVKDVLHMVKDSIESYIKKDEALAQSVINRDDKIDETYEKIINELIRMQEEKISSPSFCVYSTLVVKYIERIADHAVNIAEWVIYIISGIHKENKMF